MESNSRVHAAGVWTGSGLSVRSGCKKLVWIQVMGSLQSHAKDSTLTGVTKGQGQTILTACEKGTHMSIEIWRGSPSGNL